ncbi:hypothetical protein AVEN_233866-1 [Araneus ventricosus]|uniref:Uncharacterized protein n=1 Tax=Araneus ventricosus TaxID=182803 RepID=A0A4Y2MKF6_ARAVE|nr:hypothetical protein AVEN_233866-1 [Araneus ventricosus]
METPNCEVEDVSEHENHTSEESETSDYNGNIVTQTVHNVQYIHNLIFLGCDGTVVNTGVFNGVIRRHELKRHRPIQWIISLLHFNELPLRHLFERKSSGPSSYTSDMRRNLKACQKLPLVAFNSIECDSPDTNPNNLSCDQNYLLEIRIAISSGVGSSDLAKR